MNRGLQILALGGAILLVTMGIPLLVSYSSRPEPENVPVLSIGGVDTAPQTTVATTPESDAEKRSPLTTYEEYIAAFRKPAQETASKESTPSSSKSVSELRTYGNIAGAIIRTLPPAEEQYVVFETFAENPTESAAQDDLVSLAQHYENVATSLENVDPPFTITAGHSELMNGYRALAREVRLLSKTYTGSETEALEQYNNTATKLTTALSTIALTLRTYGITYSETESGSIFILPL
ncbi:hypothetical protein COU17_02035 [Candidatus Kaiserbacteria bacterium CG10_big_fil_rev_8_21_14_0_10_49_17]|uniref:Uncharacterized protein n=1 Tax=Candidatus Kaiserbacteria bacterium CG10_big_fil_rev_8_21_14_0_10_49_17 TaxID=1974609 RepID=A0A2M6WE97_9BACT|nr:MAG: hypothetical protein COU17_02035 [Candidatus Kaiserbacteria bacterium CG10_big_fil_rev_8_21_14_0_10_49_17]